MQTFLNENKKACGVTMPRMATAKNAKAHLAEIKKPRELWDGSKWVIPTTQNVKISNKPAKFHSTGKTGEKYMCDQVARIYIYGNKTKLVGERVCDIVVKVKQHLKKVYLEPDEITGVLHRHAIHHTSSYYEDINGMETIMEEDCILHLFVLFNSPTQAEKGNVRYMIMNGCLLWHDQGKLHTSHEFACM